MPGPEEQDDFTGYRPPPEFDDLTDEEEDMPKAKRKLPDRAPNGQFVGGKQPEAPEAGSLTVYGDTAVAGPSGGQDEDGDGDVIMDLVTSGGTGENDVEEVFRATPPADRFGQPPLMETQPPGPETMGVPLTDSRTLNVQQVDGRTFVDASQLHQTVNVYAPQALSDQRVDALSANVDIAVTQLVARSNETTHRVAEQSGRLNALEAGQMRLSQLEAEAASARAAAAQAEEEAREARNAADALRAEQDDKLRALQAELTAAKAAAEQVSAEHQRTRIAVKTEVDRLITVQDAGQEDLLARLAHLEALEKARTDRESAAPEPQPRDVSRVAPPPQPLTPPPHNIGVPPMADDAQRLAALEQTNADLMKTNAQLIEQMKAITAQLASMPTPGTAEPAQVPAAPHAFSRAPSEYPSSFYASPTPQPQPGSYQPAPRQFDAPRRIGTTLDAPLRAGSMVLSVGAGDRNLQAHAKAVGGLFDGAAKVWALEPGSNHGSLHQLMKPVSPEIDVDFPRIPPGSIKLDVHPDVGEYDNGNPTLPKQAEAYYDFSSKSWWALPNKPIGSFKHLVNLDTISPTAMQYRKQAEAHEAQRTTSRQPDITHRATTLHVPYMGAVYATMYGANRSNQQRKNGMYGCYLPAGKDLSRIPDSWRTPPNRAREMTYLVNPSTPSLYAGAQYNGGPSMGPVHSIERDPSLPPQGFPHQPYGAPGYGAQIASAPLPSFGTPTYSPQVPAVTPQAYGTPAYGASPPEPQAYASPAYGAPTPGVQPQPYGTPAYSAPAAQASPWSNTPQPDPRALDPRSRLPSVGRT